MSIFIRIIVQHITIIQVIFMLQAWQRIGEPTEKTNKIWWVSPVDATSKIETWES